MSAATLEKDLVAELLARLAVLNGSGVEVRELPGKTDSGPKGFTARAAAVWVAYNASTYERPGTLGASVQQRTMMFDLQLLVRDVSGPKGLAELAGAVRVRLQGFRCSWGEPLFLVRDGYAAHKDGLWRHELIVATTGPCVPTEDAAPELPTLTKFTLDDQDGNVLFELPPPEDP